MRNFSFLVLIGILCCTSCLDKEEITSFEATVITSEATKITATSATCGGVFIDNGNFIDGMGICYALHSNPEIDKDSVKNFSKNGEYTVKLDDLLSNTTYYVRAYIKIGEEFIFGNEINFRTLRTGNEQCDSEREE